MGGGSNYCCISGCQSNRKKKIPRTALFSFPKNPEEREKWGKAVQRIDKEIRLGDKVCELHFTEDEIIKDFEALLPDGTVWRMPKGRWSLKKGAVPTIFPNSQDTWQKRKAEAISNNTDKKSKHLKTYGKENSERTEIASNQSPTCPVTNVETPSPEYVEMVVDENTKQTEVVFKYLTEHLSYSALVNNLELLWKPSSLWGISVHDGFVVCAKWNEEGVLMKNIVIDCDLRIKVFFKNKAIEIDQVKINNLSGLTALFKDIDRCGICVNVNDIEKRNCDGYVLPHSQSNLCNYCRLIGNWEIDKRRLSKFFWLSKQQNFMKLETLYDKIHTLNMSNKLLKEQLHKMLKIKAVWKLSEQTNQTQAKR